MKNRMSFNKAITFDGFTDCWFKKTKRTELLNDWWNVSVMNILRKNIFSARLIPLNKVYPDIP
jgi:hypothetical protein